MLIRRLALHDAAALASVFDAEGSDEHASQLGDRITALVRLAALVAMQSTATSYQWAVAAALGAGASEHDVVGVLAAVAPIVGTARVGAAATEIAGALGIAAVQS